MDMYIGIPMSRFGNVDVCVWNCSWDIARLVVKDIFGIKFSSTMTCRVDLMIKSDMLFRDQHQRSRIQAACSALNLLS